MNGPRSWINPKSGIDSVFSTMESSLIVISQSSEVPAKDPAGNTRGQNCGMKSSPAAKYNYHNNYYVEKTNISVGGVIEIQTAITKDCGSEIYCACRGGSLSLKMFSFHPNN